MFSALALFVVLSHLFVFLLCFNREKKSSNWFQENAVAKDMPGDYVKRSEKNGEQVKMSDDEKKATKESMKNECKEEEVKDNEKELLDEESFQADKDVGDEQKTVLVGKKEMAPTVAIVAAETEQTSSAACEKEANAEIQIVSTDEACASVFFVVFSFITIFFSNEHFGLRCWKLYEGNYPKVDVSFITYFVSFEKC